MPINDHISRFAGLPVADWSEGGGDIEPGSALRLAVEYDDAEGTMAKLLESVVAHPKARELRALVIGAWNSDSSVDSGDIVRFLSDNAARLPALGALFLGEIVMEEQEISWISQSDVTPLLKAFPALEHLQVRGGDGLELEPVTHARLRTLIFESGGLPPSVVRAVGKSTFPELEHLELWTGSDNYGGDASVEDLKEILEGKGLPKLRTLALRDSEFTDEIAAALAAAPITGRLKHIDLSLGTLSDIGGKAILGAAKVFRGLEGLDLHHHYLSEVVAQQLQALGPKVNVEEPQSPDEFEGEEHRYVAVAE